jgi:membrane protein
MDSQLPSSDGSIEPETSQAADQGESAVPMVAAASLAAASAEVAADTATPRGNDRTDPATARPLTPNVLALELWHGFFRTGVTGLATQFAYSLLFAIFPLLVLVMSLAALVDRVFDLPVADALRDLVDSSAPEVLKPLLQELVERAIAESNTGVVSISAAVATILAVWGASGAVGTLVTASARAYGVKIQRSFPVKRLMNALLAVVIIVLIVASAVLFVFGEWITHRVGIWIGGGDEIDALVGVLRWGLVLACTASALLTLYRLSPKLDLSFGWLLPGTALATGLWLLMLKGFSALLEVTNPGDPYGAFGGLVVLLWFFYLTGVAFMLGAVVNAVVSRPYDKRRQADLARHPEKRLFCDDGTER